MSHGTVAILGAGAPAGLGGALAKKFAREGCHLVVTGRTRDKLENLVKEITTAGGSAETMVVDVTTPADQDRLFAALAEKGELSAVLYNAGNNAIIPFEKLTEAQFEQYWRVCLQGAFATAKRAIPILKSQGRGSLFFTGASASMRGKPNFTHFASAKAGLRMLAQSLAREFGPAGVHIAHFIIDGIIDGPMTRSRFSDYMDSLGKDGVLSPEAIADTYWHVHAQQRSAWTHEIDLRPFSESW